VRDGTDITIEDSGADSIRGGLARRGRLLVLRDATRRSGRVASHLPRRREVPPQKKNPVLEYEATLRGRGVSQLGPGDSQLVRRFESSSRRALTKRSRRHVDPAKVKYATRWIRSYLTIRAPNGRAPKCSARQIELYANIPDELLVARRRTPSTSRRERARPESA